MIRLLQGRKRLRASWPLSPSLLLRPAHLPHELPQRLGLLQGQPLEPCAQPTQGVVVLAAQVVAAVLMTELVNQQPIHVFGHALLEPPVAEPKQVEVQPTRSIASAEP